MCWQSLAHAGLGVLLSEGVQKVHAVLHFEGIAHHHDDHGDGFHKDGSEASQQHAMNDACLFAPALLTETAVPILCLKSVSPAVIELTEPPSPFLSGPDRPPQSLS